MVSVLENKDGTDGDNGIDSPTGDDGTLDRDGIDGIDSPTGDDGTLDRDGINGVDSPTGGDGTKDKGGTNCSDTADEIDLTDDGSIWGVMLSGVELDSWTMVVPLKAPELFNGTRFFPSGDSWDSCGIDGRERGT